MLQNFPARILCWKVCIISYVDGQFQSSEALFLHAPLKLVHEVQQEASGSKVKAIWWDAKGDPWWPLFRVGRESKLPPDFTAHDSTALAWGRNWLLGVHLMFHYLVLVYQPGTKDPKLTEFSSCINF